MKNVFGIYFLLTISHWTYAQSLTLSQLKALKDEYQAEIIQLKDADIVYPVTGLIQIDIKNSLKGEIVVQVEVWVVDSKGKLVYNNTFAGQDLSVTNFDADYMRYMRMQGKQIIKRRRLVDSHT